MGYLYLSKDVLNIRKPSIWWLKAIFHSKRFCGSKYKCSEKSLSNEQAQNIFPLWKVTFTFIITLWIIAVGLLCLMSFDVYVFKGLVLSVNSFKKTFFTTSLSKTCKQGHCTTNFPQKCNIYFLSIPGIHCCTQLVVKKWKCLKIKKDGIFIVFNVLIVFWMMKYRYPLSKPRKWYFYISI